MGGKKKGKKDKGDGATSREPVAEQATVIQVDPDFTKVRDNSRIFALKKLLAGRHGHICDLKLCLNSFSEISELTDEMATLAECGMQGQTQSVSILPDGRRTVDDSQVPTYYIYYDFKPADSGDPVMLFFK